LTSLLRNSRFFEQSGQCRLLLTGKFGKLLLAPQPF
jgi:hypothetical protein